MEELLAVQDLTVSFDVEGRRLTAVDHVAFSLAKGETLGLVGESGCGKSVTAMSLLRLIPAPPGRIESGRILFQGRDLLQLPIAELRQVRGRGISMIFQEPMTALSPLHRVGNQLVEAIRLHRPELDRRAAWQEAVDWLRKVGIPDPENRAYAYPHQFSGGMRQRAMIAMALVHHPALIVADEPTTALDVTIQAQIFELMTAMKARDTAIMLITHDMGVVWELCDRMIVMYASQIVEEGQVRELFANPLHPYTRGLMDALPSLRDRPRRLPTIPGQVPSPLEYPAGCHFQARCPYSFARCGTAKPPLLALPGGRRCACFLAEPLAGQPQAPPDFLRQQPSHEPEATRGDAG